MTAGGRLARPLSRDRAVFLPTLWRGEEESRKVQQQKTEGLDQNNLHLYSPSGKSSDVHFLPMCLGSSADAVGAKRIFI